MQRVLAVTILVCVAGALAMGLHSAQEYDFLWQKFREEHGKDYSPSELGHRFGVFRENLDRIVHHNRQGHSYTLGVNRFADMTWDEFRSAHLGHKASPLRRDAPLLHVHSGKQAADSVDWRDKNVVTPVQDQGQCGSCWSFSSCASLESAHALTNGNLVKLSELNLVDCSWSYGNEGCNGGDVHLAFQYIIDNKGIDTEASWPYTPTDSHTCKYKSSNIGATMSSYANITSGSEQDLLDAVSQHGPVSVAIDVENSFQFYSSGVYTGGDCSSDMDKLDHAVTVVGYNLTADKSYWIVKNSWGTSWGMSGYIQMLEGENLCGIATDALYPVV